MFFKLSVVIPCYNEENTIERCVERVREIADEELSLEIIIVDDASSDRSLQIAKELCTKYPEIIIHEQNINQGKGAALKAGFGLATGDFVAVQDADLEYDPQDLKRLIVPLKKDEADVVIGSRFSTYGTHRVLYFWHYVGNKFLTLLSNMFTDLNLSDMETCYKVFKREVIQRINIKEKRFGFEPEIIAKVAQMRLRIYEMGISYYGRTYEEGKKIGVRDGFRALFCIFHYNAPKAPLPIQFLVYLFIGGIAAIANLILFLSMLSWGIDINYSAPISFVLAAGLNYLLSILLLFRHRARWNSFMELIAYTFVVLLGAFIDLQITKMSIAIGLSPELAKIEATCIGLFLNFFGRKYIVFPERSNGSWIPQLKLKKTLGRKPIPASTEKNKFRVGNEES